MSQTGVAKILINNDDLVVDTLISGAQEVVSQVSFILDNISDEDYTHLIDVDGSVGKHVRHIIEFMESIAQASSGVINYDARARDKDVETSREAARIKINTVFDNVRRDLQALGHEHPIVMREKLSEALPPQPVQSSLGREVAYSIQHGIHHIYIIKSLSMKLDISFDKEIGIAPSTTEYTSRTQQ